MINGQKVLTEAELASIKVDLERGADGNDLLEEIPGLIFTVRALREMLRQVEWRSNICCYCWNYKRQGHKADCEWVAAMGKGGS